MEQKPDHTLQLQFPIGQTLFLALLILVVFGIALEVLVRQPNIQEQLAPPRWGWMSRNWT
jgi:hypothetical protein